MKEELNLIGSGFCLANWTQSTLYLPNGVTRMCGLPTSRKISINDVNENDYNLFNPYFRKLTRKSMKEGNRPIECKFCWDIEDKTLCNSDRFYKSSESWSAPFFNEIVNLAWDENYNPKYLEVGFSNVCNFKCSYCMIDYSSSWMDEIVKNGPFDVFIGYNTVSGLESTDQLPVYENNKYIESFWRIWPDIYRTLKTFRITGGEPLLCSDTWKVLDYIINEENPNIELNLSINTNLCVGEFLNEKLISKLETIINENRVKEVILYASIDTFGPQADYIRNGLNSVNFWNNINQILTRLPKVSIVIMCAYTIFSVPNFGGLLNKIYELNVQFNNEFRYWNRSVILSTQIVTHPKHLNIRLLFDEQKESIINSYLNLTTEIKESMLPEEIEKIKMAYEWSKVDINPIEISSERKKFIYFVDEYDMRFGTNFLDTFPEFTDFYNQLKINNG